MYGSRAGRPPSAPAYMHSSRAVNGYSTANSEKLSSTPNYEGGAVGKVQAPPLSTKLRLWLRYHLDIILPKLALPVAFLAFSGIFAGTTYALVRRVQWLVATAEVSSDPKKWMQEARTQAYDGCYHGCNGCGDPSYAYNACARTALANVTGVVCDGNRMWNWKDRYPVECLAAVGEFYKADALAALKSSYRNQLAIIILTFLGGVVGGLVMYGVWRCATERRRRRADEARSNNAVGWPWPKETREPGAQVKSRRSKSSKRSFSLKSLLALLTFSSLRKANAYACAGYDPTATQYFVNANRTIFGSVTGWISNCYDYTCNCYTSCSGGSSTSASSCTTSCSTCTATNVWPSMLVSAILPNVTACGFTLADAVEGDVKTRVANAGIERGWWVGIWVNTFNATTLAETDEQVLCLHDIGNKRTS